MRRELEHLPYLREPRLNLVLDRTLNPEAPRPVCSPQFIANVQPKLEPDPGEMTAVGMQNPIHTTNNSLFTSVDPSSVAWTRPPPEIVTVQSMLYASLATSIFSAFLTMLGKQLVN